MLVIHLTNLKREYVLVELPEGAKNIRIGDWGNFVYDSPIAGEFAIDTLVPLAYRKFLGKLIDLKEEDFEELVEEEENWYSHLPQYKDYYGTMACNTAKESFISSIEAEGWYTENPITNPYEQFHWCEEWKQNAIKYYNEAQKKVINLSNCYLFIKS